MKHRKSFRKRQHDYSMPGAYFVTVCTRNSEKLLGTIVEGEIRLSAYGRIVEEEWLNLAERFADVRFDAHVVMPNHLHGIVQITGEGGIGLGSVVGAFKSLSDRRCRQSFEASNPERCFGRLWHRNYHERAIRDRHELAAVREYVQQNVQDWERGRSRLQ